MAETVQETKPPEPPPKPPEVPKQTDQRAGGDRSDHTATTSQADAHKQTNHAARTEHAKATAPGDGSLQPSPEFQQKLDAHQAAKGSGPAPGDGSLRPTAEFQQKLDAHQQSKGNGPVPGDGSLQPSPEFQQKLDAHQAAKGSGEQGAAGERAAAHEHTSQAATAEHAKATATDNVGANNVGQPAGEHVQQPAGEQVKQPVAEPVGEQAKQPVVEPVSQPVAEQIKQPVGEHVNQPVAEQVRQPAGEHVQQPAGDHVNQPAGEQVKQPVQAAGDGLPSWAVPVGAQGDSTAGGPKQNGEQQTGTAENGGQKTGEQQTGSNDSLPSWVPRATAETGTGEQPGGAEVGDQPTATPRADAMRERQPENMPGPVWDRMCDGVAFNEQREPHYTERGGANEVTLGNGKRVDSYVPGEEIVSRKFTQLDQVSPATAVGYVREVANKYSPAEVVADTEGNRAKLPDQVGQRLDGVMVLEIPPQNSGTIPDVVIATALTSGVRIKDSNGNWFV
ncbi:hypothetical protein [Dactylosporangium siamense]|uniref:Uncharacterized protein n=1 Tax=Dactylosporangium siamense TaxID=685454 RepID=A0A919UDK5_9ACTN|nr:hypothetical protein [Dactylosporangium siamense]GIG46738.1 hypothetical protein Dsi01nite_047790 [Dactylosporangium siamense]